MTRFLVLMAFALSAFAQTNANQQALELAQRLGREWSVEGLETIVKSRNADLIAAYERGFRQEAFKEAIGKPRPIPPDIEAIIVRHYADPQLGPALRTLVSSSRAQYGTRELFDLMLAEWRSGKARRSTYPIRDAILHTDLAGIEPPLLDLLKAMERPDSEDGNAIVHFLGQRKYAPAIPAMIDVLAKAAPGKGFTTGQALLDAQQPAATTALLQRLASLKSSEGAAESAFLVRGIAGLPPEVPVDYAAFRKALPPTLDAAQKGALLAFIAKRKEKQGVDEALRLLGEQQHYRQALETLVALDSPEIWKRTRTEVERLKQQGALNDGQYRYASSMLDDKIASPEKHFAEQKRIERQKEFDAKKGALYAQRNAAHAVRASNPDAYVKQMSQYLKAQQALVREYAELPHAAVGLRGEVAQQYLDLGHFVRFRQKRPAQAIGLYEAARALENGLAALAVADAYQFDLRDNAQAIGRYRAMLDEHKRAPKGGNDIEAAIGPFARAWLGAQIDYLASGKTFRGALRLEDCGLVALFVHYGGGVGGQEDFLDLPRLDRASDQAAIAKRLEALPASSFTLMRTVALVPALPSADVILGYLRKHDPAGFASACLFALPNDAVPRLVSPVPGQPDPLRLAAARFNREHGVTVPKPDARMTSEQGTWDLFIGSLKRGDARTALSCLTPDLQRRYEPLLSQSPQTLHAMADSLAGRRASGSVKFIEFGGVWRIAAL